MTKTHSWTIPPHVGIAKTLEGIIKTHRGMSETRVEIIPPREKVMKTLVSGG